MKESLVWIDGELIPESKATVPINSLAVSLAASVFEAVRVYWIPEINQLSVFRLKDHLRRLYNSIKISRIIIEQDEESIIEGVKSVLQENGCNENSYIRITVFCPYKSPGSSVFHPDEVKYSIAIAVSPSIYPLTNIEMIDCCVSSWRRIEDISTPPRVKAAANYYNTRLAGFEAKLNGYDNAIFLNGDGHVAEAAESSVFVVRDGVLITPPISSGGLESITRDTVIYLAKINDLNVEVRQINRSELYCIDEMFLVNTAKLIRSVRSIDKILIGNGELGPITSLVAKKYDELLMKNQKNDWSVYV
jgi:branched-chain amino acid aminotransferase